MIAEQMTPKDSVTSYPFLNLEKQAIITAPETSLSAENEQEATCHRMLEEENVGTETFNWLGILDILPTNFCNYRQTYLVQRPPSRLQRRLRPLSSSPL